MTPSTSAAVAGGRPRDPRAALTRLRLSPPLLLVLSLCCLHAAPAAASATPRACSNDRASGGVSHAFCGLPLATANFQSYFLCEDSPAPATLGAGTEADVAAAVAAAGTARSVGLGHSWWREGWCPVPKNNNGALAPESGATDDDANGKTTKAAASAGSVIVIPTTELEGVAGVSRGDVGATLKYVSVDREGMTVTCPAGLSQRALLRALNHWDEIEDEGERQEGGWRAALSSSLSSQSSSESSDLSSSSSFLPKSQQRPRRRLNAPDGLTLKAFSWFIDQTIGGAVSTGSHGSSLRFGGLSSQLRALRVVLANGTVLAARRPDAWPTAASSGADQRQARLWRALSVSTGRLGVVTQVTMDVKPNERRVRRSVATTPEAFAEQVANLSRRYNAAVAETAAMAAAPATTDGGSGGSNDGHAARNEAVWRAVRDFDEVQAFWFVPSRKVKVVRHTREDGVTPAEFADAQREAAASNGGGGEGGDGQESLLLQPPNVFELSRDKDGDEGGNKSDKNDNDNENKAPPSVRVESFAAAAAADRDAAARRTTLQTGPLPSIERGPKGWSRAYEAMIAANLFNATLPAKSSYVSSSEIESALHAAVNAYDQLEVAVPLSAAGDCMPLLLDVLYAPDGPNAWRAFRAPALVRFVAGERAFLSPASGEPVVYLNVEDHVSYALGGGQGRTTAEAEKAAAQAERAAAKGKTPEESRAGTVTHPMMRNPGFDALARVLRGPVCRGRLHAGKAGWPMYASMGASWPLSAEEAREEAAGAGVSAETTAGGAEAAAALPDACFDGAAEYGRRWCDFGCAVAELDPSGKFEPEAGADVWWWGARLRAGASGGASGGAGGGAGGEPDDEPATTSGANGAVAASPFARECCDGAGGFRAERCRCARRAEAGGAATCRSELVVEGR